MSKRRRHQAIREIVSARPISTQKSLAAALREQGFDVTQATISRDIAEIPLQKVRAGAVYLYRWGGDAAGPRTRLPRMVSEFVVSMTCSENLVLLKTNPGAAPTVAGSVDSAQLPLVLGTIAGDDTVLIIAADRKAGLKVKRELEKMIS